MSGRGRSTPRAAPGRPSARCGRVPGPRVPAEAATPPETVVQAVVWQTVKNRYLAAGLCDGCAGQAAWGHQALVGFRAVHPPCQRCAGTVLSEAMVQRHGPRGQRWLDGGYRS